MTKFAPIWLLTLILMTQQSFGANRTIEAGIQKSLNAYCVDCHNAKKAKGKVRLDNFLLIDREQRTKLINEVEEQLFLQEMPPPDEKLQPSAAERKGLLDAIRAWHNAGATRSIFKDKLEAERFGNHIDHDKLFSGEFKHLKGFTYDREWVISEHIFIEKVLSLVQAPRATKVGKEKVVRRGGVIPDVISNPFLLNPKAGVRYYANVELSSSHFVSMLSNSTHIADGLIEQAKRRRIRDFDAISRLTAADDRQIAVLQARETFLQNHIAQLCQDLYKEQHASLLPVIKPNPIKDNRVCDPGEVKKSWEFGDDIPAPDGRPIYVALSDYKGKSLAPMELLRNCERDWQLWGVPDAVIKRRVETLRKYMHLALKGPKSKQNRIRPAKYKPLSGKEMKIVESTLRKVRKKGMSYQAIIDGCLDLWHSEHEKIRSQTRAKREHVTTLVEQLHQKIYERMPTSQERQRCTELFYEHASSGTNEDAIRKLIETLLLRAEFVLRHEIGEGKPDRDGRRMLSPRDASYAIAYALTDSAPDQQLVKAANEGRLKNRADYKREVLRLLKDRGYAYEIDPNLARSGASGTTRMPIRKLRFFRDFFGYDNALKVFKDEKRLAAVIDGTRERLVREADKLVEHILEKDKRVFETLLTTDEFVVLHDQGQKRGGKKKRDKSGGGPENVLHHYGIDPKTWNAGGPQPRKLDNRMGMLTHPAWLQAYSQNAHTDPVTRGKWVRQRLLAGTIPDLPIGVEAVIPEDHTKTLRQRLTKVTQVSECWRCHKRMNPLGYPFEIYDDFGRYRAEEELEHPANILNPVTNASLNKNTHRGRKRVLYRTRYKTAPLDSTGVLDSTGSAKLDGQVKDAHEMIGRLVKSDRVRQSIIRHAFRYFMGRNEMLSDAKTLIDADEAYVKSDGSFDAVIVSLLTSDSFIYRKEIKD